MNLRSSTFSASGWTTVSTFAIAGLQVAQTTVLAQILLPGAFSLMAVVGSVVAVALLVYLGLGQALIYYDDLSRNAEWSIYWPNMALALVLMLILARWHLRVREASPYVGLGGYSVGGTVANAFRRDAGAFTGSLVFGPAAMGVYSVPRNLELRVGRILDGIVTQVGFQVMSKMKTEPECWRHIYLQTLRITAPANFRLWVVLGLFASEIVNLLYGPRWRHATHYLRILAAWRSIRSTGSPVGSLIYATGQPKRPVAHHFACAAAAAVLARNVHARLDRPCQRHPRFVTSDRSTALVLRDQILLQCRLGRVRNPIWDASTVRACGGCHGKGRRLQRAAWHRAPRRRLHRRWHRLSWSELVLQPPLGVGDGRTCTPNQTEPEPVTAGAACQ